MKSIFAAASLGALITGVAIAQTATPPVPAAPATTATAAVTATTAMFVPGQMTGEWLASKAMGSTVYSPANDKIGEVNDFVIGSDQGIHAVIVGVGGFLGMGEKNVAVQPKAFQMTRDEKGYVKLVLDATKDQLKAAPTYAYMAKGS